MKTSFKRETASTIKRVSALFLALCMLFALVPNLGITAKAEQVVGSYMKPSGGMSRFGAWSPGSWSEGPFGSSTYYDGYGNYDHWGTTTDRNTHIANGHYEHVLYTNSGTEAFQSDPIDVNVVRWGRTSTISVPNSVATASGYMASGLSSATSVIGKSASVSYNFQPGDKLVAVADITGVSVSVASGTNPSTARSYGASFSFDIKLVVMNSSNAIVHTFTALSTTGTVGQSVSSSDGYPIYASNGPSALIAFTYPSEIPAYGAAAVGPVIKIDGTPVNNDVIEMTVGDDWSDFAADPMRFWNEYNLEPYSGATDKLFDVFGGPYTLTPSGTYANPVDIKQVISVSAGPGLLVAGKVTPTTGTYAITITATDINDGPLSAETVKSTTTTKTLVVHVVDPTKQVDQQKASVGDVLTYKIHYKNTTASAQTVTIKDVFPSVVTYIAGSATVNDAAPAAGEFAYSAGTATWTIDNVAPGAKGYVTCEVLVGEAALGTKVENIAEITVDNVTTPTDPAATDIGAKMSKVENVKLFEGGIIEYTIGYEIPATIGGAAVNPNDSVTFTITDTIPTNTTLVPTSITGGGTVAGNVITWTITKTAAASPVGGTVSFKVQVNDGVAAGTDIKNKAAITIANTTQSKTQGPTDTNEVIDTIDQNIKTVENPPVGGFAAGDVIDYKIAFVNTNTTKPSTITVTDIIPSGTAYVNGTAKAYDSSNTEIGTGILAAGKLTWEIQNVAAQDSGYVTFSVKVLESALGQVIENQGEYKFIGDNDENITVVTNNKKDEIGAKMSKIPNVKLFEGGIIEYTIGYALPEKIGGAIVVDGDVVTWTIKDTIPTDTVLVPLSVTSSDSSVTNTVVGNVITWTFTKTANLSDLSGTTGTVSFKVQVNDGVAAGTQIKNKATFTIDNTTQGTTDTDDTNEVIDEIDPNIKTSTNVPSGGYAAGDVIDYKIDFINSNTTKTATITVTDIVPSGTTYVNGTAKIYDSTNTEIGTGTIAAGKLTWVIDDVAAQDSGYVTFSVKVSDDALGHVIENQGEYKFIGDNDENITVVTNKKKDEIGAKMSKVPNIKLFEGGIIKYTIGYAMPEMIGGALVADGDDVKFTITDAIPGNTTLMPGTIDEGGIETAGVIKWEFTFTNISLANPPSGKVSFEVKVNDGVAAGVDIKNKAVITVENTTQNKTEGPTDTNEVIDTVDQNTKTVAPPPVGGFTVGDIIDYTIQFANTNVTNSATVTITDIIPNGTVYVTGTAKAYDSTNTEIGTGTLAAGKLTWEIQNVAAQDSGYVTFSVKVLESALGTVIENQGEYKFIGDDGSTVTTVVTNNKKDEIGAKMSKIPNVKLFEGGEIEYTIGYALPEKIGGAIVADGDVVSWTITDTIPTNTVLVPGSVDSSDPSVTSTVVGNLITWTFTETVVLATPTSGTVSFKVRVNDGVPAGTDIKNKATFTLVNTTQGTNDGPDDTNEVIDTIDQNTKTVAPPPVGGFTVGDIIEYTIQFENTNAVNAATVTVTDKIPDGTAYVAGTAKAYDSSNTEIGTGTLSGGVLKWTITGVAPQDSGYVTFDVKVLESALGTVVENQGEFKFIDDDGVEISVVTNKKKDEIGAKMSKVENIKLFEGGIIEYTIGYALPEMIGGALVADGDSVTWTITDTIPTNTVLVPGSIDSSDPSVTNSVVGNVITWTLTETVALATPTAGTVSFKVKVNDGVVPGTQIKNKANIKIDNNSQGSTEQDDTNEVIDEVDQNTKTVENLPVGGFKAGDVIDYKIEYVNTSINPSTVTITDIIPEGTVYVQGSAKAFDSTNTEITGSAGALTAGTLKWVITNVAAQDSGYVTFSVKVSDSALGTTIKNQGEYKFIGDNGETITVKTNEKKDDIGAKMSKVENTKLFAGGIIEYTIGYAVPEMVGGALVADGNDIEFTITDQIPANTTLVPGSITDGGIETAGVITWVVNKTADTSAIVKGTVSFKVQVNDNIVAGVDIKNKANITVVNNTQGTNEPPEDTNEVTDTIDDDNKETTIVGGVDIGDIIPYFIEFENELTTQAKVVITDAIPAGTAYVNNSAKVFKADGVTPWDNATDGAFAVSYNAAQKTITWTNAAGILPGTVGKVYFEVKVTAEALMQEVENEAVIKIGTGADEVTITSNKVTTTVDQTKASEVIATNGVLAPNGTILYTVGYANNTAVDQNVTITDAIPAGTTYVPGSITGIGGDTSALVGGVGTLTWTIPNVAPGTGGVVSFRVRVDVASTPGTEIRNRAIVNVGGTIYNSNETVDIVTPKDSTVTPDPGNTSGNLATGDRIDYVIAYANSGTKNATVFIVDNIPTGAELIAIPAGAVGYDENDAVTTVADEVKRLEWTITPVVPGQSGTVRFAVIVTATGGSIRNTGTLTIGNRAPQVTNTTIDSFPGGGGPVGPNNPVELDKEDHCAYIIGYGDNTVRPNKDITRAEVATIFFRLLTKDSRDAYMIKTNAYSDVSADQWYNTAISTLANAGIITGYPDGTFRPNASITRAELATMAARFDDLTTGTASFTDVTTNHWAYSYIISAATKGWVVGYQDGTFLPDKAITRAETVTLINRVLGRDKLDANSFISGMITWPDNVVGAWYYEAIQEAGNGHEYTVAANGNERWTKLNPPRDWAALEN